MQQSGFPLIVTMKPKAGLLQINLQINYFVQKEQNRGLAVKGSSFPHSRI